MEPNKLLEAIRVELKPILDELKAEIVELSLKRLPAKITLQLFVDKEGGINIDECAIINSRLGDIIEAKNLIDERYILEVSSPGLDRPLKTKRDFERVVGKKLDIWLVREQKNKTFITGRLKSLDEKGLTVESAKNGDIAIDYETISRAVLKL
jgi:ribosome maturation factor RimP